MLRIIRQSGDTIFINSTARTQQAIHVVVGRIRGGRGGRVVLGFDADPSVSILRTELMEHNFKQLNTDRLNAPAFSFAEQHWNTYKRALEIPGCNSIPDFTSLPIPMKSALSEASAAIADQVITNEDDYVSLRDKEFTEKIQSEATSEIASVRHAIANQLVCDLLRSLGCSSSAAAFEKASQSAS